MEQPQYGPWTAQANQLRLSPLSEVIAARNGVNQSKGGDPSSTAGMSNGSLEINPQAANDPRVPPGTIEAAQAGDENAISLLEGLGLVGGPALLAAMYRRKALENGVNPTVEPQPKAPPGKGGMPIDPRTEVQWLDWEEVPPDPAQVRGPANQQRLTQSQARLPGPPANQNQALTDQSQFHPPGPTQKQMQEDQAYLQNEILKRKQATRAAQTGSKNKAERLTKFGNIARKVIK